MREVGELAGVGKEDVRQDLQAMFRGAVRASLELFVGVIEHPISLDGE